MAKFSLGTDVETTTSQVPVDIGPNSPLGIGAHVFQLVVEDDTGLLSAPAQRQVVVRDDRRPTAVLGAPSSVPLNGGFTLDGSRSTDAAPGEIVKYIWTLLS